MPTQIDVPATFTLSGDYEHRVLEVLKVAQHQVRLAQGGAAPRMQDALVGLEDALSDQIAWLENAAEDDKADAEEFGRGRAGAPRLLPAEGRLMAARPIWRGHLRLALVSCPVALYNARHDRTSIRFNLINPDTGNRIRMITQDAETGKELRAPRSGQRLRVPEEPVSAAERRGSRQREGRKLVGDDRREVRRRRFHRSRSTTTPPITWRPMATPAAMFMPSFAKRSPRPARWRCPASSSPSGSAPSPCVPWTSGLMAHTLYEDRDLNSGQELFEGMDGIKVDPEMVQLATQLVQRQSGKYDASDLEDRYETRLRALIDAKLKGEGIDAEEEPEIVTSNVVDLMATLKKSLGQVHEEKPAPKKKAAPKRSAAQAATKPSRKRA